MDPCDKSILTTIEWLEGNRDFFHSFTVVRQHVENLVVGDESPFHCLLYMLPRYSLLATENTPS